MKTSPFPNVGAPLRLFGSRARRRLWSMLGALFALMAMPLIAQPALTTAGGLVGHWNFDEGSGPVAADSSGYGNHGRLLDGPQWQTTQQRPVALLFHGVNDHVNVGNSPSLNPPDQITLAAWVAPYDVSASGEIIAKSNGTDPQYFLRVQAGGRIRFGISGAVLNGNITLSPADWHLVAGTYDGSSMKIYVDGVLDAVMSMNGPMHNNGVDVWIGARRFQSLLVFDGLIDDPQIYNRALSASEIQSMGNLRPANDDFANSFDLAQITTGNNANATLEPGEPDHNRGRPVAGHSVWWHWTAPSDGEVVLSTQGSSFDTVLAVYTGSTVDHLSGNWSNDNWKVTNAWSKVLLFAWAGTTYHIAVDGVAGEWGDVQLIVHYDVRPTLSLIRPNDGEIIPFGTPIDVEATASDSDGFVTAVTFYIRDEPERTNYWQFADDTSPYSIAWTPPNPGEYTIFPEAEDNDGWDSNSDGVHVYVYGQPPTVNISSPPDGAWFLAPASITVQVSVQTDSGLKMLSVVLTDGTTTIPSVPPGFTFPSLGIGDYVLTATATDIGGQTATTSSHVHVVAGNTPPPNDNFANSFDLAQLAVGYNFNATTEPGEPNPGSNAGGHSIWWHWTAPSNGPVVIDTLGSSINTVVAVYEGTQVDRLGGPYNFNRDDARSYSFMASAGATYRIRADGVGNAVGNIVVAQRYGAQPTVTFSSPHDGDFFPLGTSIHFAASPHDADNYAYVAFITIGNDLNGGNVHQNFYNNGRDDFIIADYTPPEPGIYDVQAGAYDQDGFEELPNEIHITVGHGVETVSITSPADGAVFNAPADIPVHVHVRNFDGTVVKVDLTDGTTTFTSTVMDFDYTFPARGPGNYTLTATATDNTGATATSSIHVSVVIPRPANDDFTHSFDLAQITTGNNVDATLESGEPNPGFNAGGHSIWWHWTAPSDGPVVIDTLGSSIETVVALYVGTQVAQLQAMDNLNYHGDQAKKFSFIASAGTIYQIRVDGVAGAMGNIVAAQHYGAVPTIVITSPHDGDVFPLGAPIYLSATVSDSDNFADGDGFTIDSPNGVHVFFDHGPVNYTPPELGNYTITASASDLDGFEAFDSVAVSVGHDVETVRITSPADGAVFNAPADIPVHVTGNNFGGTVVKVDLTDGTTTFTSSVMDFDYTFAALGPGNYTLTATATDNSGATATSRVHISVVTPRPANDDFANSFDLAQITTGNNVNATREPGEPNHDLSHNGRPLAGHTVWWHWTAPSDGNIVFSTLGSSFDTGMAVYRLHDDGSLSQVRYNDNWNDTNSWSKVSLRDVGAGITFCIAVDGVAGELGDIQLNVRYGALPTLTLISPRDGDVFPAGTPIVFEATASDSDGSIVGVAFEVESTNGGNFYDAFADTSPYVAAVLPMEVGQFWFFAFVFDDDGFAWGTSFGPSLTYGGIMPSASITSPVYGQVFDPTTTAITIRVNVIPGDGAITKVDYYSSTNFDQTFIGTVANPPYDLTWYPAAPDVYALHAFVTDSHGFYVLAEPGLAIALEPDYPVFPVVTLVGGGGSSSGGQPIRLTARVSNYVIPPDRVEFYAFTPPNTKTLLGVAPGFLHLNNTWDYDFFWNNAVPGGYDLTAKAIFGANSVESPSVHITVTP